MMQGYYRTAKAVTQLNTILLQNLEARLLPEPEHAPRRLKRALPVWRRAAGKSSTKICSSGNASILESFLMMMQHPELRGMTAPTLARVWRAAAAHRREIPPRSAARLLFVHLLQQPRASCTSSGA